jgi:hypothetical protein
MLNMNNVLLRFVVLMVLLASFPVVSGADDKTVSPQLSQTVQMQKEQVSPEMPMPGSKQQAPQQSSEEVSGSVIRSFATDQSAKSDLVAIQDKTKRLVMFLMGVPLLILLFATAVLGVAMGVYGKQVFVPHMVCAGLSLTLALAHAVVGIVWFYPF